MNSPAHDIALYLQAQGIGAFGTDIFVGDEPAEPADVITVYDYAGDPQDTDDLDDQPRFQVRVRNTIFQNAWAKQAAVKAALTTPKNGIVAETSVFPFLALVNDISSLGRDGNRRAITVANYRARRENKETA